MVTETRERPAPSSEVSSLIGSDRVKVVVRGRTFYQEELGIEQAADVGGVLLDLMSEAFTGGAISEAELDGLGSEDLTKVFPILTKLARFLPVRLGEVFAAALVDEDGTVLGPEDRVLVRQGLKLRQAMGMVRTFVKQNDLADIVASFTSTRDAVSRGLKDLQETTSIPE